MSTMSEKHCDTVKKNVIDILVINNKGFVWNADDWYFLRTTHRILGNLVGTLPLTPRREDQNGVPCVLLPEEVRLLVENNIGHAVKYPILTSLPSESNALLRNSRDQENIEKMKREYAYKKANDISKLVINTILANGDKNCNEVLELHKEVNKIKPLDLSPYAVIHFDELCSDVIEVPLPELITQFEILRYKVFKDLWSKGFYLTCGVKFGGDFLVYEADPLSCHAKYIVSCRELDKSVMISQSRISSITKKKMVLAKNDKDSVKYLIYQFDNTSRATFKKPIHFTF